MSVGSAKSNTKPTRGGCISIPSQANPPRPSLRLGCRMLPFLFYNYTRDVEVPDKTLKYLLQFGASKRPKTWDERERKKGERKRVGSETHSLMSSRHHLNIIWSPKLLNLNLMSSRHHLNIIWSPKLLNLNLMSRRHHLNIIWSPKLHLLETEVQRHFDGGKKPD